MEQISKYLITSSSILTKNKLRVLISELTNTNLGQIRALTRGWSRSLLYHSYNQAIKFKPNPAATWWLIRDKHKEYTKSKPKKPKQRKLIN